MSQELTVVQKNYLTLSSEKGFDAFIKLFELSGNEPAQAKSLAEKEAYHLAQLMSENSDLANIPPSALVMEIRKIPLQGVSLDPTLKLAYLLIQDKSKGKVSLEITGRGKAVQAIAQNIIRSINAEVIFEGDEIGSHNGLLHIIPKMNSKSKVVGGILTIIWSDGRSTQDVFRESHIDSWRNRSAKRFNGKANANYTSFNGGMEPGFIQSKMLKHKLDRVGINPFPGAYKKLRTGQIESLPEETSPSVVVDDAEPVVVGTKIEKQVSENGNSEPQDIEFENL
jgi:recombinational DNA repair protein RecT